ncbi:hypothetical protein [Mumia sp. Pv 4-285]|uniref:hypothetical protein n=1 Tax=Mumia qirimensis TaxID=3234852 RepID=UPI00351D24A0
MTSTVIEKVRVRPRLGPEDDGGGTPKTEPSGDDPVTDPATDPRTSPDAPRPNEPYPEDPRGPGTVPDENDERNT